jgi:hypothetical protein
MTRHKRSPSLMFDFGGGRSAAKEQRRLRQRQLAERRAELRRQKQMDKRHRREAAADLKRSKRRDRMQRKAESRRRRQDDRRQRVERKRQLKEQKRNALGAGNWRPRGNNAAALRTAHNLLSLANAIGVRFTEADTKELLEFADSQIAQEGDDFYTLYNRIVRLTYIGRRVRGVVGQYDVEDVESTDDGQESTGAGERLMARIVGAAELLGRWNKTTSVEQATAQGIEIAQVLGASPEAIKRDQRAIEQELTDETYDALIEQSKGKSTLWMLLHPGRNPNTAEGQVLADLEAETRETDAVEARLEKQADAETLQADVAQLSPVQRIVYWVRNALGG